MIRAVTAAGEPGEFLIFLGKQRTISPISHRSNFTKFENFERSISIGVAMKTFDEF